MPRKIGGRIPIAHYVENSGGRDAKSPNIASSTFEFPADSNLGDFGALAP